MYKIIILALFLNVATALVRPVCRFACTPEILKSCPALKCGPNESPQHPETCGCCMECLPIKSTPGPEECETDCEGKVCPIIDCIAGYVPVKSDCHCCDVCKPVKNPPCEADCKAVLCPLIKCAPGYISVTPPCKCCNECKKIEKPDDCQTDCSEDYNCPQIRCRDGYELVKPKCGCCEVCQKKEECQTDCSRKYECPLLKCKAGYKLAKPKCGCCEVCTKIRDTCGKDEVYNECGSTCPPSCSNLGKNQVCSFLCVEGCFCRKGLVRNDQGECVLPKKCPKNTCRKDEVYKECGSACPQTCSNLGKNQVCTEQCVIGCFCRNGLVRNDNGECVQPQECPKSSYQNSDEDSNSDSSSDEGY